MTSSLDKFVRLWSLDGTLVGNVIINHPLPIHWDMQINVSQRLKKKIFFAIKLLDITQEKYKNDYYLKTVGHVSSFIARVLESFRQEQVFQQDLQVQLAQLQEQEDANSGARRQSKRVPREKAQQPPLTINIQNIKRRVEIMRDEFSPRDLKFKEVKKFFEKELRGQSLKQMEAAKRLLLIQQRWKQENKEREEQIETMIQLSGKKGVMGVDKDSVQFLSLDYQVSNARPRKHREGGGSIGGGSRGCMEV